MNPVKQRQDAAIRGYGNPSLIREDYNREQKERQGYYKRPLLELLQNIEDALKDSRNIDSSKPQTLLGLRGSVWVDVGISG